MPKKISSTKIIIRNERIEAYQNNELIGYVEDDTLYGMRNGYAEPVGPVNHRVEIAAKLAIWRASGG